MLSIVKDYRNAGLTTEEVALMALAKRSYEKPGWKQVDIQELREFGLR